MGTHDRRLFNGEILDALGLRRPTSTFGIGARELEVVRWG
jgi:hypothetical protein